jgi:DNA polymerase III subunit chi
MPKVNFYLLKDDTALARQRFACRLAEQLAKQGQPLYLQASDANEAAEVDTLLWHFTAESFVPHALGDDPALPSLRAAGTAPAVLIGAASTAPAGAVCVLNLTEQAVTPSAEAQAIGEFILNNETEKARSRKLWQHYKQLGFELQLHQL